MCGWMGECTENLHTFWMKYLLMGGTTAVDESEMEEDQMRSFFPEYHAELSGRFSLRTEGPHICV